MPTIKNIVVLITGGIAAYKVPLLVRSLMRADYTVRVAMTPAAATFVTPATLATLTKHEAVTDDHEFDHPEHVVHVELAQWADMMLVVPATANSLAKFAQGLADNVVSTSWLAFDGPKLVVPAMNDKMWANAATQSNVRRLKDMGVRVLPPAEGFLAEGYTAVGRMPDLDVIQLFVDTYQAKQPLAGKQVLVSAGGTQERIDPVRYIGNDSSGKMGTAVANAAAAAGADVTLVATKMLPVLPAVDAVYVTSAAEMHDAMLANFEGADLVVMAAAVADFRPTTVSGNKIKKQSGDDALHLDLVQNPDILAEMGAQKSHQYLVGFAAETNDLVANAQAKLERKGADMIVANPVGYGQGFNTDTDTVTILRPDQAPLALDEAAKTEVASTIVRLAAMAM
ncbi:bifunctional phosphopantothenoylcysteine decarboxylase/phosphopantothenate--cysteine ligase CoaBC [Lacticaseibacillus thailandensis]|uniref:Coenzyme A biosynthesis bifunctional protein CoaBC n=1 Tax=Lacticaseibacillus thailandensis DSM 22698 = JCM 13996 TaxID=1423810 RepID=A0A0R2C6Y2_9LACO|nr:bifunctional phosphopantothenoylcysteine decarboxylase/phosphopantothenate--cysteine ligase CoaBC [Lacticaseibacillus thailandensis]KRM87517.1 phosphopantothenoylcysteine decarboxylase phosphopantothenate-cysteine ligase [Lacticaseibacillus thailandensis DSM 22698 = JCM 13996]